MIALGNLFKEQGEGPRVRFVHHDPLAYLCTH